MYALLTTLLLSILFATCLGTIGGCGDNTHPNVLGTSPTPDFPDFGWLPDKDAGTDEEPAEEEEVPPTEEDPCDPPNPATDPCNPGNHDNPGHQP